MIKVYDEYHEKPVEHNNYVPAGAYVCKIIDMHDHPEREYVCCVWDIAEGEYANNYSSPELNKGNRWRSHCMYLSYKSEFALRHVRHFFDVLNHSNPGFNAAAAWDAVCDADTKDFSDFIGKCFGAGIVDNTYESHGNIYQQSKVDIPTIADFVRSGKFKGRVRYA